MTLDSLGVRATAFDAPAAVRANVAAAEAAGLPAGVEPTAVVLAVGPGSTVVGRAVEAVAAPVATCPVVVWSGEAGPAWAGPDTLVLSLRGGARPSGVHRLDLEPPAGRPQPIAEAASALAVLGGLGIAAGLLDDLRAAADHLDTVLAGLGGPKPSTLRLARHIGLTFPLVYGGGAVGAAAAASWKDSINRNAKAPAFANAVPGLDHDEVCGWGQHGDVTRQVFTVVTLRHPGETAAEAHRLDVNSETCEEIAHGTHEVRSDGATPAAALLELMLLGELTAVEMAAEADVDPGPTPVTQRFD